MITIAAYYLIDYENVHSQGLTGFDKTKETDRIIIFFTKNATSPDMTNICRHGGAKPEFRQVADGKQSADMHIISYVGYLTGARLRQKAYTEIVIVSKDTDYDKVIKFWKEETGFKIKRAPQIAGEAAKVKASAKTAVSSNEKQAKNNEIIQLLSGNGLPNETIGFVASTVVKNFGAQNRKQEIYRAIITRYNRQISKFSFYATDLSDEKKYRYNTFSAEKMLI